MIRGFEDIVPELEKWQEQNPDQSLVLTLMMDNDGNTRAMATIRTLLGTESSASFNITGGNWLDDLLEKIKSMSEGRADSDDQSRAWTV
jgi:hypothetical protein